MNQNYLGKIVKVVMDRPLGSKHPKHGFVYEVNYGYIPNTVSGDGEEIDAYVLGECQPLDEFEGEVIAIIHRLDDNDDKLIVVKQGTQLTDDEIRAATQFQEQWFKSEIIRPDSIYNTKIIIIRGNSGSGKSTITKNLKSQIDKRILVLEQDLFRHEFITVPWISDKSKEGTRGKQVNKFTIEMILLILKWAKGKFDYIILDGIYSNNYYRVMFEKIVEEYENIYAYYFDLPFEETAKRHLTRAKSQIFTVEEMRQWLKPNNKSTVLNEKILTKEMSIEQITQMILRDICEK